MANIFCGLQIVEWQVRCHQLLLLFFRLFRDKFRRMRTGVDHLQLPEARRIVKLEVVVSSVTSLRFYGNCLLTLTCVIAMAQITRTYNTPSWAVSDLQSPPPQALRALGISGCKSDISLLGVL